MQKVMEYNFWTEFRDLTTCIYERFVVLVHTNDGISQIICRITYPC